MTQNLKIYTDGGARNNPGPGGIGVVIYDEKGKVIKTHKEYIGEVTNNQAEYSALVKGLELASKLTKGNLECYLDSELVVKQLSGHYKIKNGDLRDLAFQARQHESKFQSVRYKHIPREKNELADKLVNEAIDASLRSA